MQAAVRNLSTGTLMVYLLPTDDIQASADYRKAMTKGFARRTLTMRASSSMKVSSPPTARGTVWTLSHAEPLQTRARTSDSPELISGVSTAYAASRPCWWTASRRAPA